MEDGTADTFPIDSVSEKVTISQRLENRVQSENDDAKSMQSNRGGWSPH